MSDDDNAKTMPRGLRTIIETPYAAPFSPFTRPIELAERVVELHKEYARACMTDSLRLGEAPFLSHLLYTQVLDDNDREQRAQGISAGFAWMLVAEQVVAYTDLGLSWGMVRGLELAHAARIKVIHRSLEPGGPYFMREVKKLLDEGMASQYGVA